MYGPASDTFAASLFWGENLQSVHAGHCEPGATADDSNFNLPFSIELPCPNYVALFSTDLTCPNPAVLQFNERFFGRMAMFGIVSAVVAGERQQDL